MKRNEPTMPLSVHQELDHEEVTNIVSLSHSVGVRSSKSGVDFGMKRCQRCPAYPTEYLFMQVDSSVETSPTMERLKWRK